MKVGSLVVIKPFEVNIPYIEELWNTKIKWLPVRDEKTIYTIRGIDSDIGVYLEEGIIGYNSHNNREISIRFSYVKEVQPPISSEEIAEIVNDAVLEAI